MKLMGIISVGFHATDQLLIRFSAFVRNGRKMEYTKTVHQLFIDFKKAYNSVRGGSLVQYFLRARSTCEISQAD
jgi:hypothetical protein